MVGPTTPDESIVAVLKAPVWRRFGIPLFFWTCAFFGAALALGAGHPELAPRVGLLPALIGALLGVALWRRRAVIRRDGVAVGGLLRPRVVRFDDLQVFTYDARSYRLYLPIPIGRIARLTLKGARQRVVFHAGFAGFDRYVPLIVSLAVEATVSRMRREIDGGQRARFGRRLSVDRASLHVRQRLGTTVQVGFEVLRVDVADGSVFISDGTKRVATVSLARTPNLLALPQLVAELAANRTSPRPEALAAAVALSASAA